MTPKDNRTLKTMLNGKNILFKNYKRHGYKPKDKLGLTIFLKNVKKQLKLPNQNS